MKPRIILLFFALAGLSYSQTNTAADPVFLTKAQKEELRRKAEQAAAEARAKAAEEAKIAKEKAEAEAQAQDEQRTLERMRAKQQEAVERKRQSEAAKAPAILNWLEPAVIRDDQEVISRKKPSRKLDRSGAWRTYDVKPGDSQEKIATEKKMSLDELHEANPQLKKPAPIMTDQRLWVWDEGAPTQIAPDPLKRPGQWRAYNVRPGDSAAKIAGSNGMTLTELNDANQRVDWAKIRVGEIVWIWEPDKSR